MKKWFVLLMILALLPVCALAASETIDLETMSFDELVALKSKVELAMWGAKEWQEVTVPQGVYTVGEDIPAGHWTIKPEEGSQVYVKWSDTLDESGKDIAFNGKIYFYESVYSESNRSYEKGELTQVDLDVQDGQFIVVDSGNAVFTPYTGKANLGFK